MAAELEQWKEETTLIVNAAFYDEDNAPVTPDSARYAVHDGKSGVEIVPWTDIADLDTDVDIEITAEQMAMRDTSKALELRRLTVHWEWGEGRAANDQYLFNVQNLPAIPEP